MPPAEILHRIVEQLRLMYLRFAFESKKDTYCKNIYLYNKFKFCASDDDQLPLLEWDFKPSKLDVKQWLCGAWPALNHSWRWVEGSQCWDVAPDKGNMWPSSFFNAINYRAGNPYGDVRVAWEPSRLQQLVALALVSREKEYNAVNDAVTMIESQLRDWLAANKYLSGIHYISSMECALRIVALCHTVDMARENIRHDSTIWCDLLCLVETHASLIEKRLSLYSSSGNHTISEAVGLLYAGINFPEFKRASIWKEKARALLNNEADRQILADGGSVEQSFWYLLFVSDLYGLADRMLDHIDERDERIRAAHERARHFITTFAVSPEQIPDIGDSDNGYALSKFLRISFDSGIKRSVASTFGYSGYSQCNLANGVRLIFDHGELGMSPSFGHGHADCLSLLVFDGNREVIADCGTYGYAAKQEWRKYFKSTASHNTVTVDGLDQATYVNGFMWKDAAKARLHYCEETNDGLCYLAQHDGYSAVGVTHWRGVYVDSHNGCFVWDCLTGQGEHDLVLRWHVIDDIQMRDNEYIIDAENKMRLSVANASDITVSRGELNPISGWKSSGYGEKSPISTITANYQGGLPHEFSTQIFWSCNSQLDVEVIATVVKKFKRTVNAA